MRVLHLISGGDSGGAKTHVITLLTKLQKEIDLQLICLSEGALYDEAVKEQINVTLFNQKTRLDFRVFRKIIHLIQDGQFDILHCHGARANFVSMFIRRKVNIPIITTVHSDYRLDFNHSVYKKIIFTYLNKLGLRKMDYYLSVTQKLKDALVEEGFQEAKIIPIYNGLPIVGDAKDYSEMQDPMIFGCATRLVPIKGTEILLKAINECKLSGHIVYAKIAGVGEANYTKMLIDYVSEHHLEDQVEFLGFVKDMDGFYKSIDVNILPSFTEGFPYALLESGSRGIATIASKAGGIVEMIEDQKTGRLFEVGDYKGLADILIDLITGKQSASEIGASFRADIKDRFSDDAMVEEHIRIYNIVIQSKR